MLSSFVNKGNSVKLSFSSNPGFCLDTIIEEITEEGIVLALGDTPGDLEDNIPAGDDAVCNFYSTAVPYGYVIIFSSFELKPGNIYLKKPKMIIREESRQHQRVITSVPVLINEHVKGRIINISLGGALIETDEGIEEENLSKMRFEIDSGVVEVKGIIVRKELGNRFAIKFSSLESAEILLKNFLLKNKTETNKRLWGETFTQYNISDKTVILKRVE